MINEVQQKGFRVRKMTQQRLIYTRLADSCVVGGVSRGALIALAHQLPVTGIINATEQSLLITLINTADVHSYEKGGRPPIVFKSNATLAFEIGRSEGRVSRLLSRLFDCGLIVMRDSANFKRFSSDNTACGIDLRVLVARYDELKTLVDQARTRFRELRVLKREYTALRNQLRFAISTLTISPCFATRLASLLLINTRNASGAYLKRLIKVLQFALYRVFSVKKPTKTTNTLGENDIHKHNTTNDNNFSCKSNNNDNQNASFNTTTVALAFEKRQEKIEGSQPLADEQIKRLSGETLSKAFTDTQFLINRPITSVNILIEYRFLIAKFIGCSLDALNHAEKVMGLAQTALALAVTYEKYSHGIVKSGGGYLRALTKRCVDGRLHIIRSLFALRMANND